jgi:hypothetical protein
MLCQARTTASDSTNSQPAHTTPSHSANTVVVDTSNKAASILLRNNFLLDHSGATDHICSDLSLVDNYVVIPAVHVNLPNGAYSLSNIAGTIKFTDDLILRDVLFIPDFKLNIIAVSNWLLILI